MIPVDRSPLNRALDRPLGYEVFAGNRTDVTRRGRSQGLRRPGTGARRSFWCVRPSDSRRNRRCTRDSASASRPPWRACNDASSGRKSRSIAAPPNVRSDACSAATHVRRRGLCDPPRRRPNLAGWPATRMVAARRMGRLVASQRRLLCAAHQSARLELRGDVADLYPALRSRSGLSHP